MVAKKIGLKYNIKLEKSQSVSSLTAQYLEPLQAESGFEMKLKKIFQTQSPNDKVNPWTPW